MRIIKSGEDFNEDTISFLKEALRIKEISIELIRK
jgi:hypothetical protein